MAAPTSAFEIGVSGLYNQGFGNLSDLRGPTATSGRRLQDNANAGVGAELDLGIRVLPEMSVGAYGTYTEYQRDVQLLTGTNVRSMTGGLQGQWFFMPYRVVNPWISLGTAYRAFWTVPEVGPNITQHGWQIARVQVGADMRASREVSIGPYVGGSVETFLGEQVSGQDVRALSGPPVSGFVSAGIAGRFDVGGRYIAPVTMVGSR